MGHLPDAGECTVCRDLIGGFGHNGNPLVAGRVCSWCNYNLVLPLRIHLHMLDEQAMADGGPQSSSPSHTSGSGHS